MSLDQQKLENEDVYKDECEESSAQKPQQTGGYTASLKSHEILCIIFICAVSYRDLHPFIFYESKNKVTIKQLTIIIDYIHERLIGDE